MSTRANQPMTNEHVSGGLATIGGVLHLWRERRQQRRELSLWSERDMHDIGLSPTEVMAEADKPFWRA